MITQIESAIITRLREGLGRMVSEVQSYGGELDDVGEIARVFPAVWVTFAGVQNTRAISTHKNRFYTTGRFSVLLGAYNLRDEACQRKSGQALDEVGCNRLIYAVRRLMTRQDMGLPIEPLLPGKVRSLFSTRLNNQAISVYACEFDTVWIEDALECGRWPTPEGDDDPDSIFTWYQGRRDGVIPWHESTHLAYHLPGESEPVADDIIQNRSDDDD